MTRHCPPFISIGGELQYHLPYDSSTNRIYGFLFKSPGGEAGDGNAQLQRMVDAAFNQREDRKWDYLAVGSHFGLVCARCDKLYSLDPEYRKRGWMKEYNFCLTILTAATTRGPNPKVERLAYYMPYLFVDNQFSLATGREVIGFHKNIGSFEMPEDEGPWDHFGLSTFGMKKFSPETEAKNQPLMSLDRDAGAAESGAAPVAIELDALFHEIANRIAGKGGDKASHEAQPKAHIGLGLIVNILKHLANHDSPLVFLKQFRDVEDSSNACYQAINEMNTKIENFKGAGILPGPYHMTLHHMDSHPIDTDFGVPAEGLEAELAFYMDYGFRSEEPRIIQEWVTHGHARPRWWQVIRKWLGMP
jgi:hypothetical protein